MFYRITALCCAFFLWAKGLRAKDINKKIYPVYGGKFLSRKAVHKRAEKFSRRRSKVADDDGVRRTGKAMGQVYQCWWGYVGKKNVLPVFKYHMFYFLYINL
jgi:hypothetical protein